jgi:hypothetical protein
LTKHGALLHRYSYGTENLPSIVRCPPTVA